MVEESDTGDSELNKESQGCDQKMLFCSPQLAALTHSVEQILPCPLEEI